MTTKQPQAFPQQEENVFNVTDQFGGYVSKPEITDLLPNYLVKGSKNVLVDYANRIISRNGYSLYNQANTGAGGIKGSYEWETSSVSIFSLRSYDHTLEFDWNGMYNTLLTGLRSPYVEFAKVLDYAEQQDVLLMVLGEQNIRRWSGGVSKIRASTATTLQKQGVIMSSFVGSGTSILSIATPAVVTITAHGLMVGDKIIFSTTGALPTGVVAGQVYYVIATGFDANDFQFSLTMGGTAIISSGTQSGTQTVSKANLSTGISFVAGDGLTINPTILDANANFLNAGFAAGDTLNVSGSMSNNSNFTVASVTANIITLIMSNVLVNESAGNPVTIYNQTGPTWKSARFFSTISGRAVTYKGVNYTYTGGENTDTLTGLTAFPTIALGDPVWQMSDTIPLPTGITTLFPNFFPDLIGVQLNIVTLASTKSSMTFGSQNTNYTNFTLTSPRAPGDPYQIPLTSGPATCIVPIDTDASVLNLTNTLIFGSGIDAFDQIDFHMSQDNSEELLRIIRYKTAKGKGLISKSAICPISSNTVYISREPALDSFSEAGLEKENGRPISDAIKDDFDSYNFTDAHVLYWKRALYIALPAQGLLLIYDLMRNLWQPPQTIPVGRLAIINDWLYGHSSITNETYRLFTGTNDNGIFISQVARFAYNNGGTRYRIKNMSEYWSDGYISANGQLALNLYYGFAGSAGAVQLPILGNDPTIVVEPDADPLGDSPLGSDPLGGSATLSAPTLFGSATPLLRFHQIDTVQFNDYFEFFAEYAMNTLDGQFALVATGSDQWDGGTSPNSIKK